jgi:hypothetical protein
VVQHLVVRGSGDEQVEFGVDQGKRGWVVHRVSQSQQHGLQLSKLRFGPTLGSEGGALNFDALTHLEQFDCGRVPIPQGPLEEILQGRAGHRLHDGAYPIGDGDDVLGRQRLQCLAHHGPTDAEFRRECGFRRQKRARSQLVLLDQGDQPVGNLL